MARLEDVLAKLPGDLLAWVTKHADITVKELPQWAGGMLSWDEGRGRFVIAIAPRWDVETAYGVLMHEIAHLVRGDLVTWDRLRKEEGASHKAFNVATDASINGNLLGRVRLPRGSVTYDWVKERFGDDAPSPSLWVERLYRWLLERGGGDIEDDIIVDILEPGGGGEKMTQAWMRAALSAPPGVDVPAMVPAPKYKRVEMPPVARLIQSLLRYARGGGSIRLHSRTHLREGRVPGLRGVHRPYAARVVLAMDTSGSMAGYIGAYEDVSRALGQQGIEVERWVWADKAAPWPDGADMPDVGGGTQLVPLLKAMGDAKPDALVIFTDGEIADGERAKALADSFFFPIIWAVAPHGRVPFDGAEVIQWEVGE